MTQPEVMVNLLFTIGRWQDKWRLRRCRSGQDVSADCWAGIFRISECVLARLDYGFDITETPEALANGRVTGWDGTGFVTATHGPVGQDAADHLLFVVHDAGFHWWENIPEPAGEPHPEVAARVWTIPDAVADRLQSSGTVDFDEIADEALAHRSLHWDGADIVAGGTT